MKRRLISIISLLLCSLMLLGALAACKNGNTDEGTDTSSTQNDATTGENNTDGTEDSNENETTEETEDNGLFLPDKDPSVLPSTGDFAENIQNADALKNGVTSYFTDGSRNAYKVENGNMTLDYVLEANKSQLVTISNKSGNAYIENTMDVFIKMKEGGTYYASGSQRSAIANLFRYGYYYYDVHFYDQDFVNNTEITAERNISLAIFTDKTDATKPEVNEDGILTTTITNPQDPQIRAPKLKKITAENYNALRITMKTTSTSNISLFLTAGKYTNFNENQRMDFSVHPDGEFHTYTVILDDGTIEDFTGEITSLRLDFNGVVGETVEISEITAIKISNCGAPNVRLDRNLHTYTDRMHQVIRLIALTEVNNIEEVGMITKISADTVAKLIVKDKNNTYDTIEGVDWESAEYIGFDIKDAGIFGYIMPDHEASGKMTVTLEDGYYVIKQTTVPENNTLKAPIPAYTNRDPVVTGFVGTSTDPYHSESEFDFGQRIYTDDTHDFEKFLFEAYCERNPIPAENIVIDEERSPGSTYDGYDPLRGIYCFTVKESIGFRDGYYYQQNKHCPVSFKITGDDKDRNIYVLAFAFTTSIECAAVLDKNDMMLPIPLEVSKNFSNEFEEAIYAWGDIRYSEVRFPMVVNAGESHELTVLHLYQNWGHMPLKQISSIQFFAPYYHLSTGCSESNCIASYYVYDKDLQTLPDHRAMSAPLWESDPQHTNAGYHYWLQYTDSEGNYYASEDKVNIIDAAGPTYAALDLNYVSDDGKIKVTYNHMEMPQTDENRTYYQMNYEVLDDISFKNFSRDFSFYSVNGMSNYDHIGYLDENNKSQIVDVGKDGQERLYKLGDDLPYFDMFEISTGHYKDDYANVSFIIYNSEFTIGGKKTAPGFVIVDQGYRARLSLDLEEVTLKKGDKFTINAIIMPWGSQETNYDVKQPDKSVLNVRKYNLRDPLKITSKENAEVIESVFLPKVKSTNGKTAEFVLSGGDGNTTFRVYGFEKLTNPKLYELVTKEVEEGGQVTLVSEWVQIDVSSITTPDSYGNAHAYDGYAVHYDGDGTYSYSFVTAMEGNAKRTFRVDASHDFEPWPETDPFVPSTDVYFDHEFIPDSINTKTGKVLTEDGIKFTRIYGDGESVETCLSLPITAPNTGDLVVIKYRIPTTNAADPKHFQVYIGTDGNSPSGSGDWMFTHTIQKDGEWHVMAIDLSEFNIEKFVANEDGTYNTKYMRFDIFNTGDGAPMGTEDYADVQFIAICKTMDEVMEMSSGMEFIDHVVGDLVSNKVPVSGDIDESSYFNLYLSAEALANVPEKNGFGKVEFSKDGNYVRYYGNGEAAEANTLVYTAGTKVTGKYFVLKYRLPNTNVEDPALSYIEFFTATSGEAPSGSGDFANTMGDNALIKDGEWHVLVLDVTSKATMTAFTPDANGNYTAKYIRFDVFNGQTMSAESYMDVAFLAICEDPAEYLASLEGNAGGEGDGNVEDEPTDSEAKYFNLYFSASDLKATSVAGDFSKVELAEDESYVSFYGNGKGEAFFMVYSNGKKVSGQYFVVKYRIPTTNPEDVSKDYLEFFTSTVNSSPKGFGDESDFANTMDDNSLIKDGEWHVLVLDVTSKPTCTTFPPNADGKYIAKFIRFDVFNQATSTDSYIDIAFLAVCEDPSEYLATLENNSESAE